MDKQNRKDILAAYKQRKVIGGVCAVKNKANGKMLVAAVVDIQGYRNRLEFSKSVGGCTDPRYQKDWEKYGAQAFILEVLEELEKKETQSDKEFKEDIETLKEIWLEKLDPTMLY